MPLRDIAAPLYRRPHKKTSRDPQIHKSKNPQIHKSKNPQPYNLISNPTHSLAKSQTSTSNLYPKAPH